MSSVSLSTLHASLNSLLRPQDFRDYSPNGLQVEGRPTVRRLVTGVTASQALIDAAVAMGADALLVHHGYFWQGEDATITGIRRQRIHSLLNNNLSLFAYHLPLDAHAELGNNAQLAALLGLQTEGEMEPRFRSKVGNVGRLERAMSGSEFAAHLKTCLGRAPLHVSGTDRPIERLAWCTGAAQSAIETAWSLGVDAYLTGEVSEQTVHFAREMGMHFFAAGHHATERYGVQAVGGHIAAELGIEHRFIDIDNPV